VHALDAREQFAADRGVVDGLVLENRARDGHRPLGVVGRLADPPLALNCRYTAG
jgi:hypothetical protein